VSAFTVTMARQNRVPTPLFNFE